MGSFSIWHWLIVLLVVVLIFGTKRLTGGAKDLGTAVKEFKKAIELDPKFADGHLNFGNTLYAKGKFEEAISAYYEAARLQPHFPSAFSAAYRLCRRQSTLRFSRSSVPPKARNIM